MRADRLVSLVLLLQARGRVTAQTLAAELEVSVRTVYRDVEALNAVGVPIRAESGPGGGCQLLEGYRFPLRGLRPEEAEALLLLGVPGVLSELGWDGALTAAHRQVRVTAGLAGDAALVHLDMPRWFRASEPVPCLRTAAEALHLRRYLALEYRRGGGGGVPSPPPAVPSPRVVGPLGLVNKAGIWYLVASNCDASRPGGETAGASRPTVFRVGRIGTARVLAQGFERPTDFDLAGFWAGWSAEFEASRPLLPVRVRASPRALAAFPEAFGDEIRQALDQAPADAEGWRVVGLSFEHEMAAAHRLAGFGGEVEVLSPASVRARLLAVAQGIIGRYGSGSAAVAGHDDASGIVSL